MTLYRIDGTVILKTGGSLSEVVSEALRRKLDLTDATIEGDMTGVDFTGATLYNAEFRNATLDLCNFTGANLRRVAFLNCKAELAVFHGADMDNVNMQNCSFLGCDLAGAQLSDARIHRGFMTECSYHRARAQAITVTDVRFTACNLTSMVFRNTLSKACRFTGCDFTDSEFGHSRAQKNTILECICPQARRGKDEDYDKRKAVQQTVKSWVEYFKKLRERNGYSVEFVARAVGATPAVIRGLESSGKGGNIILLIGLMRLYNLSLADVYYGTGDAGEMADEAGISLEDTGAVQAR